MSRRCTRGGLTCTPQVLSGTSRQLLRTNLERAVLQVSLSAAPGENFSGAHWQQIGCHSLTGTRCEIEKQIRIQDVSTRVQLQQLADATVARSSTYSEYRDHFEAAGVELVPILQKDDA